MYLCSDELQIREISLSGRGNDVVIALSRRRLSDAGVGNRGRSVGDATAVTASARANQVTTNRKPS